MSERDPGNCVHGPIAATCYGTRISVKVVRTKFFCTRHLPESVTAAAEAQRLSLSISTDVIFFRVRCSLCEGVETCKKYSL